MHPPIHPLILSRQTILISTYLFICKLTSPKRVKPKKHITHISKNVKTKLDPCKLLTQKEVPSLSAISSEIQTISHTSQI